MRPLDALIDTGDPAWSLIAAGLLGAANHVEILSAERARVEATLVALQVTTRSPLGAIALETGGMLVDDGWIRLLGGGGAGLSGDLARWNGLGAQPLRPTAPGLFIVGYDAIGGFFAIDGGALGSLKHNVFYFAPDTLRWEDMARGYGDFLDFLFVGDLAGFYADYRWPSWKADVSALPFDEVFSVYPPLWTREGKQLKSQARGRVPALEAYSSQQDAAREIEALPDGARVRIELSGDPHR